MISLDDYLAEAGAKRWLWGSSDCVHFGLGWARARSTRVLTPALPYASATEAAGLIARHGSLLAIVTGWMAENGFAATERPDDGDIGVAPVARSGVDNVAGAAVVIRCGPWWLAKAPRGLASVRAEGIPAWRI